MPTVELITDVDCPNVEHARAQLQRALAEAGLPPQWRQWDRADPASPARVRAYGSPTILVDGKDVAHAPSSDGANCCRVYRDAEGRYQGVPTVEMIAAALGNHGPPSSAGSDLQSSGGRRGWLAVVPAVLVAALPVVSCPACWPAYAGLLSALGLPLLVNSAWLLPLCTVLLAVAIGSLGFRATRRRGYGPFVLGSAAAIIVIAGKFWAGSDVALYGGIALLLGASAWNSWPKKAAPEGSCPSCAAVDRSAEIRGPGEEPKKLLS